PLVGALAVALSASAGREVERWLAVAVSVATLLPVGWIVFSGESTPEFVYPWLVSSELGVRIELSMGLDGLSIWLFGLSALLVVTSLLVSWEAIRDRAAAFYSLLLLLSTGMLVVFA